MYMEGFSWMMDNRRRLQNVKLDELGVSWKDWKGLVKKDGRKQ